MKQSEPSYMMLSGDTEKLFSWHTLLLFAAGLAINLLLAKLVIRLGLPLYVDNVGSILVGALAGPIPGAMVGFLSNAFNALDDAITMYYGILTIVMAILASFYTKRGWFRCWGGRLAVTGSCIGIGGAVGSVMTWLLYGGGIGGIGAPIAEKIYAAGVPAFFAQLLADMIIDIPDKAITVALVVLLLHLCTRLFPGAFPLSGYYELPLETVRAKEAGRAGGNRSVSMLILHLIILCSALVSTSTMLTSYYIYCGYAQDTEARLIFLIRMASVSFAVTILICIVTVWLAARRISTPVNQIVEQSRAFMAMPSEQWLDSDAWKNRSPVKTGDEIEELYDTICIEQETVAQNVMRMKETEEKLRHSQELEDALENARQASQAKGQFLSRMSHEIRTPLNAVIGYMEIAEASPDDPDRQMHCIRNSSLAAKHLLSIINDVLDVSSIESGKMKIASETFSLREQLATVSTLFYGQAKEKGVRFDTILHGPLEEWLVGDSLRVNQILLNLLSNAVKFTPAGGAITLSAEQLHHTDGRIYIKFEVKDNGIGMSEEFKSRLFKPFEQESATTAHKYGGTGLGLSITGNLVSMMNGAIDVVSKQGEGSCFTVTIPFGEPKPARPAAALDGSRKLRALIVGDAAQAKELKTLLRGCGLRCDTADTAEGAVRQVQVRADGDYAYDVCLLDWNAPGLDCALVAQQLRQAAPEKAPRMVALAYDAAEITDAAHAAGVTTFLTKPVFPSAVVECLAQPGGVPHEAAAALPEAGGSLAGIHILLAEDNPMNREIAVCILKKADILVDEAEDGQKAVELFEAHPNRYSAILMDVQMPVLDGFGATRKIRSLALPQAKSIPILAMTANAFHEDVAAALSAGMNDHIAKPVNYDKLFRALRALT